MLVEVPLACENGGVASIQCLRITAYTVADSCCYVPQPTPREGEL